MRKSLAALALLLVACGDPSLGTGAGAPEKTTLPGDNEPDPDQKYQTYGLVWQGPNEPPQLCLGPANDTMPPGCEGPRVEGWNWDAVPVEGTAGDYRWGTYEVTGYYDGKTFTLVEARVPEEFDAEEDVIETPCEEPPGGWRVEDPERAAEADRTAAIRYAENQPEHAATWVVYIDEPTEYTDVKDMILNIAFTEGADVETFEAEMRQLWDGPLCVIARPTLSQRELSAIQNSDWGKDFGLHGLWSSLDVVKGTVEIGVVLIDSETRRAIDERYGEGVVIVYPAIRPVE
ncbi:MAG: hypothetical protein ACRDKT_12925 [Actinomycetota bacterium]